MLIEYVHMYIYTSRISFFYMTELTKASISCESLFKKKITCMEFRVQVNRRTCG